MTFVIITASLKHSQYSPFRYGLALGFVAVREKNDRLLLTAVGQINHGGPQAVIDGEQAVVVANLNSDAGKKALSMSDFFAAYSLFNHGISYLRGGHWEEHYDLSLELFNLAMKCALSNAEHEKFKALAGQVMQNAKCFEDKCQAISASITLFGLTGNVAEAVELINSTLTNLGEGLPTIITPNDFKHHLESTKELLASLSDDALLSYPVMTNPSKILVLELLAKQHQLLPFVEDRDAVLTIPLKLIQISLMNGMSPMSPVGYALYGNYLALVRNEFEEGYRYVKLALSLMKKSPSRAHDGYIMFQSNYTKLYVEPMQSAIELYPDAIRAAMKSGNPVATTVACIYGNLCFWSGKELKAVVFSMEETIRETKYHKNLNVLRIILPVFRMIMRLMGEPGEPQQDHDQVTAIRGKSKGDVTGKHASYFHSLFFVRLSEALIFRELDKAKDAAKEYFFVDQKLYHSSLMNPNMYFRRL